MMEFVFPGEWLTISLWCMKASHRAESSENTFYFKDVRTGRIQMEPITCVPAHADDFMNIS